MLHGCQSHNRGGGRGAEGGAVTSGIATGARHAITNREVVGESPVVALEQDNDQRYSNEKRHNVVIFEKMFAL